MSGFRLFRSDSFLFMSGGPCLWSGSLSFWSGVLHFRSNSSTFMSGVPSLWSDSHFFMRRVSNCSNENKHSSHPPQLFSKSKKSRSPIDVESGFVNMIHLLFAVRKLVRMRIDKMRFHLFHRVLYLSEP